MRDHLLAGPGLSVDVDWGLAAGQFLNLLAQLTNHRRVANQPAHCQIGVAVACQLRQFKGLGHQVTQLLQLHRLREKVKSPSLQRGYRTVHVAVGSDDRHRCVGLVLLDGFNHLDAVAVRQAQVGQAQVEVLLENQFPRFDQVLGTEAAQSHLRQRHRHQFAEVWFVVNDQNAFIGFDVGHCQCLVPAVVPLYLSG